MSKLSSVKRKLAFEILFFGKRTVTREETRESGENGQLGCDSLGFVQWCVYSIRASACVCPCVCLCWGSEGHPE